MVETNFCKLNQISALRLGFPARRGCVGGFIGIGQGFVMIDLIAEVALGIRQIVPIPCLAAVQLAALSHSRILVFVDVVGVLAALGGKAAVLACAFELFCSKADTSR